MSLAPTYSTVRNRPSLLARIDERKHGITFIPTGVSGITKPVTQSYTERYRGTEFEMHVRRVVVSEPLDLTRSDRLASGRHGRIRGRGGLARRNSRLIRLAARKLTPSPIRT